MLSGEHAVLCGYSALVAAVAQWVRVHLQCRQDDKIRIQSDLGGCTMRREAPDAERPFHFVAAAIRAAAAGTLPQGFDLSIAADMPPDVGLGSSAAVTVAVYTAVYVHVHGEMPAAPVLWRSCRDLIRGVQGCGSGADVAASVFGGLLLYAQEKGVLERFDKGFPSLVLGYVGYKTPTAQVIEIVQQRRYQQGALLLEQDVRMEQATQAAATAIRQNDQDALAGALQAGQAVMCAYGVCDENLAQLITRFEGQEGIKAAKISGSGLGDCVLALGRLPEGALAPYRQIPVRIVAEGLCVEVP